MRRSIVVGAALAMLCVGCSDPATSRLAVGSKAMVVDHNKDQDEAATHNVYLRSPKDEPLFRAVGLGTHVTVVEDDDRGPEGAGMGWGTRNVLIHIEDGEYRGTTAIVSRYSLHPE